MSAKPWILISDTREQVPLTFPQHLVMLDPRRPPTLKKRMTVRVHVIEKALDAGDYALEGHKDLVVVERKGSLREVAFNCLNPADRSRFLAALGRLSESCRYPVLFLEGNPAVIQRQIDTDLDMACAVDALQRVLRGYGVEFLLYSTTTDAARKAAGQWIARLLINGVLHDGRCTR